MLEMPVPQVGARRGYRMGSEETLLGHQLQCNAHRSSSSIVSLRMHYAIFSALLIVCVILVPTITLLSTVGYFGSVLGGQVATGPGCLLLLNQ